MSDMAQCAHMRVNQRTVRRAGGEYSEEWRCNDCETRFVPMRDLESARAELQEHLVASGLEHWAEVKLLVGQACHRWGNTWPLAVYTCPGCDVGLGIEHRPNCPTAKAADLCSEWLRRLSPAETPPRSSPPTETESAP